MKIGNYFLLISFCFISHNVSAQETDLIPMVSISAKKKILQPLSNGPERVIDNNDIKRSGITSLSQALHSLGGAQLQDSSSNDTQVVLSMRGFGGNAASNSLFLVNGIPLTNPDLAPPNLGIIPLANVALIKIIAGSESVLYGDQAVGGVIAIDTQLEGERKGNIRCNVGSYNLHDCNFDYANYYKSLKYALSFDTKHTDNYRDHNHYDLYNLMGQTQFDLESSEIKFDYQIAQEKLQYPGALTKEQVQRDRRQASNATDYFKDWNGFLQLRIKSTLGNDWQLENNLSYRAMNGAGVLFSSFSQNRYDLFFHPQLTGQIETTAVNIGADVQADRYHLQSAFGTTADGQHKYSLFALMTSELTPCIEMAYGGRVAIQKSNLTGFSDNSNINRAFASTVGFRYKITSAWQYYLRRAESYRFPKADENASTSSGEGLRTQRGVSYESGVGFENTYFQTKFDIFLLDLRDEIAFDPLQTPQNPFGTNRNLSPTRRYGMNVSIKYQLTDLITAGAQYHFVNARFQDGINAGNRIPLVAEHIVQSSVDYNFYPDWYAYLEYLFTGNQYPASDDNNRSQLIGGYSIFNFSLRYEISDIAFALRLNNIFNKHYNLYTVFQTYNQSVYFYPAPERNFTLSATLQLG